MKTNKNNKHANTQSNDQKDRGNNTRRPRPEKAEATPMAKELLAEYREDIRAFLTTSIDNRSEMAKTLFAIPAFPVDAADVQDNAKEYKVYCLERSVRLNRDDPSKLTRMSGTILYQDAKSGKPAYMVSAFITPSGSGNVTVFTYGERGIVNRVHWSSDRDGI